MRITFTINGMQAYKFGESWVTLSEGKAITFERLGQFVAWASDETYKALTSPRKRQPVYFTGLN